ncbi:MAG: hypothetical protein ACE5WD_07875 [Candidatus Aminicenantia bacterium]
MSWRTEWKAISDRIQGLLAAGTFFIRTYSIHQEDQYGVANRQLLPQARNIYKAIEKFYSDYKNVIPITARECLERFLKEFDSLFSDTNVKDLSGIKVCLTTLASFCSELEYQLSDYSAFIRRLSERAFIHLQRSIIVDRSVRERWQKAFKEGETSCEKLGGAHLLLHGIWAFKVSGEGERTDLVLGDRLEDLTEVERTAEALVLTEWKIIRNPSELSKKAKEAKEQAARYSKGILAGFELEKYRYLVLVSEDVIKMPPEIEDGDTIYRYINIAVDPKTPSSHVSKGKTKH